MKRSTEEKIKANVKACKDVQDFITDYKKREDASAQLISDLEELAKSYEKVVFKVCAEE